MEGVKRSNCEAEAQEKATDKRKKEEKKYKINLTLSGGDDKTGKAYCRGLVADLYANPKSTEDDGEYTSRPYSEGEKANPKRNQTWKIKQQFVVPYDLDESIPGDKDGLKYSNFGDWVGRIPREMTEYEYENCYEGKPEDIFIHPEGFESEEDYVARQEEDEWFKKYAKDSGNLEQFMSVCWTDMIPVGDGTYTYCEEVNGDWEEGCGMFITLEGYDDKVKYDGRAQHLFVTYDSASTAGKFKPELKPISPCSSGLFHYEPSTDENAGFCGCCAGRGSEGHYIFPTPTDLAESNQKHDDVIYLTKTSHNESSTCIIEGGDKSSIGAKSKEEADIEAEERKYTNYGYTTYKMLCNSGDGYAECLSQGCQPRINASTGARYTESEWTKDDDPKCEPKCGCRNECNLNEKLMCSHISDDLMCLGAGCVWHMQSRRCSGRVSFREKKCEGKNCEDDCTKQKNGRRLPMWGLEKRRAEQSSRALAIQRKSELIFDKTCSNVFTTKFDRKHCNIDSRRLVAHSLSSLRMD